MHASLAQGLFYEYQAQDLCPHTPGGSKNTLSLIGIPLKKETSGNRR